MSIDLLNAYADAAVATNGTLTFTYPSGRSADSYAQTAGAVFGVPSLQALLKQGVGFTLNYGTTTVTLTYLGTTSIPAASGVALILQLPLQDTTTPFLGGAASQPNTDPPVPIPPGGSSTSPPPPPINSPQLDLINFGAFPGTTDTTLVVQGQDNIVATSVVEAWIEAIATVDHSVDEHWADPPRISVGNIVPGVGFTIYGNANQTGKDTTAYGNWTVAWSWQ